MGVCPDWVVRCARRYRFDRNPLRRRSDRIEGVAVLLILLILLACLWPALAVAGQVYRRGMAEEQAAPEVRQPVVAVLLQDATSTTTVTAQGTVVQVKAKVRWQAPDGSEHVAVRTVPAQARAGSVTRMWVDEAGDPVAAPRQHVQTVTDAAVAGFGVMVAASGLLFSGLMVVRWLLDRRRYADWDAAWESAEQRWRPRKQ
ncbi:hypothetical protein GCM10009677_04490 [Sphaerisporangium rubeum]|uniref:Na+-transporting methylmalonyl-CoA/oxaloacetate decarboxylase gamma subunit n=1 Tax=Sphaerisporangium rubeum TaxID=321317 RepID=A0A7X0I8R0_9ACTN|nr:hypothetical protein [Sphaerisporangium rubeum]MBB6470711.1 Na+-transporting methylmalonyl-CoA/oxaloacetate decarboxylase gamma subunit [Sphaerisporangium rubeum]